MKRAVFGQGRGHLVVLVFLFSVERERVIYSVCCENVNPTALATTLSHVPLSMSNERRHGHQNFRDFRLDDARRPR